MPSPRPDRQPEPLFGNGPTRRRLPVASASLACLTVAAAHADIARTTQEVLIPFDDAQLVAEWVGPSVPLPGVVRWARAEDPATGGTLFDVSRSRPGDTAPIAAEFRAGDTLVLFFGREREPRITLPGKEHRRRPRADLVAFDNLSFGLEPSGPPRGRGNTDPFEEALFVLRFTNAPAPSAAALFGLGGLMLAARRRRPAA